MSDAAWMTLDEIDRQILTELQQDGRISTTELAQRVNLSQPAVFNRVKRLENAGFIEQYVALLNRDRLGYDLLCFIHINIQVHTYASVHEFRDAVIGLPQVLECHHLTGEYDYLLKVVLKDRRDLERFIVDKITALPGVSRVQTSIVLSEVKATTALLPE